MAENSGKLVLSALAAGDRNLNCCNVCIVVAHPDDETIACGGQLHKFSKLSVVLVTDGAPRNLADAKTAGFQTAAAYAQARYAEFFQVLAIAKVDPTTVIRLGLPDQSAAHQLGLLVHRLTHILFERRALVALTHAFEGGHPDHDAVAFAVHTARALLRGRGRNLDVLEFPLYRAGDSGVLLQSFPPPPTSGVIRIVLDEKTQAVKQAMLDVYATQRRTLRQFSTRYELFRPAPDYDFCSLPNDGRVLYDHFDWGLKASDWRRLAHEALDQLGLGH
jgi:N-acetylglucosamine malate deacetylase 2